MGTTAQKLEYLNTTKQLIKESINLTDANITTQPFRQYATILKHRLPEIVGDPSIIWNNYEHVSGTGTSFSITAYNSIFEYQLKGDTTQNGTPTPSVPVPINTVTGDQVININSTQYPISLGDIELCKIGTYQDYIYKDNGKWYLHKEIGKVVLNGSETWHMQGTGISGKNRFCVDIGTNVFSTSISNLNAPIFSDKLKPISRDNSYLLNNGDGIAPTDPSYYYKSFIVFIEATSSMTIPQFTTWLASNNIPVYYALATPTTEEIKNYELFNQLNALSLYTGTNTITVTSNDLPATLDLTALKYN